MSSPTRSLLSSLGISLPWCCLVPGLLALAGAGGALGARLWLTRAAWFLLPLAVALLGRAWWLAWGQHRGGFWTRGVVLVSTLLIVILWLPRLAPLIGGLGGSR